MSTPRKQIHWLLSLGILCLLPTGLLAQGGLTLGDAIYVDFGAGSTTTEGNWNNITSASGGIEDAIAGSGVATSIDFALPDRFNGVNENGTTEPDEALGFPASATRDSFYGNDVVWGGLIEPTAQLVVSDLDPSTFYELTLFCSRMSVGDVRQTEYAISGDGGLLQTLYLDPANNVDTQIVSAALRPTADGILTIDIQKGPDNNNGYGFFYLGTLVLRVAQNLAATQPSPANGAADVATDATLSWTPGQSAATHNVYFGTDGDAVANADVANPMDVLVSLGQTDSTFDPGITLELGQTYYWRVDEVNGAPDHTVFPGEVWSFTAEPLAYPIANITATASAAEENSGPENTVNGSGLNENDGHSIDAPDMWLADGTDGQPVWIQFEFDKAYMLHELLVWNYNIQFEPVVGFGVKDVTIETSTDGATWTALENAPEIARAPGAEDYAANTVIDLDGIVAQYVRLTVNAGWGGLGQYGLSEVRFTYIPTYARYPVPADDAGNVAIDSILSWRTGRGATAHDVYFSADEQAVVDGTGLAATVTDSSFVPADLELGTTYFWKVDEVDDLAGLWAGDTWSFITEAYLVVEDFESYTDDSDAGETIYQSWIDGWENGTGSVVGHIEAPFAETTTVHSGRQSMPLFYENNDASTAETDYSLSQDWTANGIAVLSLYIAGDADNTGQLYLTVNDARADYAGDITNTEWQLWNVDLSTLGASLGNVTKLTIGIEGSGATGVVYVDDIRLYRSAPE